MNYANRWTLAVALKRAYPRLETGEPVMVPGTSPPEFIDQLPFWVSAQSITDPQRRVDMARGRQSGAIIGIGFTCALVAGWWFHKEQLI